MYEYYNNTLTVSARNLIDNGIMSEDNYRKMTTRKVIRVVRRGCLNTPALIDYNSLPERFRKVMELEFGDPTKKALSNVLEQYIIQDTKAIEFYSSYEVEPDRYLPQDVITEYYTNAIVLNAIHQYLNKNKTMRKALGGQTTGQWHNINQIVLDLDRSKYPHTLPTNDRCLYNRYKLYMKVGLECLIHKNYSNKNSAKVADEKQQALLVELLAHPLNWDNEQVAFQYNLASKAFDWKPITAAAVAVWRKKNEAVIYAGRRGATAFRNTVSMQVKRSAPTAPLYYWTIDGWDAELLFQKFENGKTTYHHRPTIVIVLDAFNKYPIGYAIGTHETPELITAALQNAIRHTQELFGQKYRSHQIQSDHYAMAKMSPIYDAIAHHSTPARVKNAKAKIIEPYFKSINKKYCQMQGNWAGFGITSNKESQANGEWLNKFKKHFPNYDGVCEQLVTIIEKERSEKREAMLSTWQSLPEDDKLTMSQESYLMTFGSKTKHRNMMEGTGLNITINGVKRSYDCFDLSWRNHAHVRWEVRFDPEDLSRVMAVNEDQTLRYILEEKYIQPMALKDRKPGDGAQLQRVNDFNASLEKQVTDIRAKNIEQMADIMTVIPQLDTLNKLMITDSKGQHKNNRNENRKPAIKQIKKNAEDVESGEFNIYGMY